MTGLWSRLPFIGRLLVTASTAILIAGTAMVFVSARQEAAEIRMDLSIELVKELDTLPAALSETVVVGDFSTLQQTLDRYVDRPLIAAASFRDTSGTVLASAQPPAVPAAPAWFLWLFDFADVEGYSAVIVGGRSYGELSLVLTARRLSERAWGHLQRHLAILFLAVLVDFVGIWLVLRSGLSPLKQLEEGARAMAAGRLDVHLRPAGSPELRSVIDSFNRMVDAVWAGQSALRQSEERLANVLDATGEGIWDWNIAEDRVAHNARWGRMIGLTEVPAAHGVDFFIGCIHPDDRQAVMHRVEEALSQRTIYQSEHRMLSPQGQVVWVMDRGQAVAWDTAGRPLRMVGSMADITDRKQAEAALIEAKTEAEAANLAKSRFLANMSHEIRTPMNAVLGLAQVLEREPLSPEHRSIVEHIRAAGRSLLVIINDILDLSKIERGQIRLEALPFDLARTLTQLDRLMGEMARAKGLDFAIERPAGLVTYLRGDPLRLEQILFNLVGNAVKFTEQGAVRLRVLPGPHAAGGVELRFEVSDTGIGIAPEHLALLGRPFSQADDSITRRFGGTGLGLAISQHLVQLMGGTLHCESRVGHGSTFWFVVTLDQASGEEVLAVASPQAVPAGQRLSGMRCLVVDDQPWNRDLVERALQREGARATSAVNGQQALDLLRATPGGFDLVLMDIQMPVMDGLTATRAIREDLGWSELPVIAFSAGVLSEERETARAAGVNDFLAKPVDLEELIAVLRRWSRPADLAVTQVAPAEVPAEPGLAAAQGAEPVPEPPPEPRPDPLGALPAIPGLDTRQAAALIGGDRAFFMGLLRTFAVEYRDLARQVRPDLATGQSARVARQLHALRGLAGNLGANALVAAAQALESGIAHGVADLETLAETFEARLTDVLEAVAPWLEPSAAEVAPSTAAPALDPQRLARLRAALSRNDLAGLDLFRELRPALAGVLGQAAMEVLAGAIQALQFADALALLAQVDRSPEPVA